MDRIEFTVNGEKYSVGSEVDSDVTINDYIRNYLNLRGTKYMCKQGTCGTCIVSVVAEDIYGHRKTFSVNSCLVSITSCEGWNITTTEGIGGQQGYHPVQKTLAEYNGTQCGYCSPGWIMSMYSLLESHKYGLTQTQIEDSFGSNTCRCTGYRPILDAFKSFATNNANTYLPDIEDLKICKKEAQCKKLGEVELNCDKSWCIVRKENFADKIKKILLKDNRVWYRVNEVQDIFKVFEMEGTASYMLVNGNTGRGAVPIFAFPKVLIDIKPVQELKNYYIDQNLVIGAGMALNDLIDLFEQVSKKHEEFSYLQKLSEHLNLVAHIPVRNIASIAGNLMLKHREQTFSSDVFLLLETVCAILTIASVNGSDQMTPEAFLGVDMTGKLITQVKFPPLSKSYRFISFKVMPRAQNAHAQVNAAFLYELNLNDQETVTSARIVIGGLSSKFVHAVKTEKFLRGRKLFTNETLQLALHVLEDELVVQEIRGFLSSEYRKKCALGLFYKGLLNLIPEKKLKPRYRSGARDFRKTRPLSKGSQEFDTNPIIWPLNEPIPRLEALIQCSGEATYANDIPTIPREVFCAFVPSEITVGEIEDIDPSLAIKLPGVLAFLSAKDIPGSNNFIPTNIEGGLAKEEIICERNVKYYNQPIGIIVAETEKLANRAALLVKAKYKNIKKQPVLTISDAITREPERVSVFIIIPARDKGLDVKKVIKGRSNIFWQYHYHMETQTCVTKPNEDGIEVLAATQWPDQVHVGISQALKIAQNRINLSITRLGGAFGAKIFRNGMIACACALVTHLTNRPCRFVMSMQANMRIVGKRSPSLWEYEVGVNNVGEVQYLEYHLYEDNGYIVSDPLLVFAVSAVKNCYDNKRWQYKLFNVTTDTASNTYARSPGALEAIAMTEHIMERISYVLDRDPLQVRLSNLNPLYTDIAEIVSTLMEDSEYKKRKEEVQTFNKLNRWKKRGLRLALMSWPASTVMDFHILMTVYHGDGSVEVRHGGIEIGQGINTKVAQTVAYVLQIPLNKVKIKPTTVSTNPNTIITGGSRTTHAVCFGAIKCCQIILDRLSIVREILNEPTWELLIETAYMRGINLQASYRVTPNDEEPYRSAGAVVTEVELDILTGEHDILRVDIMQDVGLSINPKLDIGQIEGAFIMGTGYWTCEHLIYDNNTGELLTDRAWNYHVPLAKDIPIDFRIKLRKNSFSPIGTLGAKSVTEPPTCLAVSVAFALREAIVASREDSGYSRTEWFEVDGPFTLETNVIKAETNLKEFLFE
ncbi:unnamed protein product [Parnassius mnemosyne]|uniref:Aldehyde oxidase n=1 Tax=Parnassius mnemosyne TaxID=213953 RepID=A0AAV1L6C5_9NEOP